MACSSPESEIKDLPEEIVIGDTVYVDGVYSARGEYGGLPSHITVTVTLTSAIVSNTQVQTHATDPTSLDLQRRFAAAVPEVVNGKHISQVRVGRLAGSSGTPVGFNDAIRQIKQQAAKVD
ncbi:hypothetical protein [Dyadobacter sp. NIV53]|uniref:hypothetical protein n=1 Tax=Dyadobacter sp. NIV53 TaxID=2861765 RepID=UPI001C86F838|nr:hypothetical protein [Dyadobacter sp. NIV53]